VSKKFLTTMLPLNGIRVIDLTTLIPGALCAMLLGDFGADVIKVEEPKKGDPARSLETYPSQGGTGVVFAAVNRNKRSLALDLKSASGKEILYELSRRSHVLVENFRPSVKKKLGVEYNKIRSIRPEIVYCSISSYGQSGPYVDVPAHDLNFSAYSGVLSLTGAVHGHPSLPGFLNGDCSGALMGTIGVLVALLRSIKDGSGEWIDISNTDSLIALSNFAFSVGFATGNFPGHDQLLYNGGFACYNCYRTKDNRYLAVTAIEEKFWKVFVRTLGREDLQGEFLKVTKQRWLKSELKKAIASRTLSEWTRIFMDVEACVSPVHDLGEALGSDLASSRGLVKTIVAGDGRQYKQIDNSIKFTNKKCEHMRLAPPLKGEHTKAIMMELGYSAKKISELGMKGCVFAAEENG
jgi:crotonobetainyl-CoA:carnitine CoA-transferase CaiB-like acyl-CoA transferase